MRDDEGTRGLVQTILGLVVVDEATSPQARCADEGTRGLVHYELGLVVVDEATSPQDGAPMKGLVASSTTPNQAVRS